MQTTRINPEVFFANGDIVAIKSDDLGFLHEAVARSPRGRARVCAHRHADETLHEMIVVLTPESYLIPEKHVVKVESYHVIKGLADVVIFDDEGEIVDVIEIGDYESGRPFYFRVRRSGFYHSLVIRSADFLYREAATGPFSKADTVAAPWAPPDSDDVRKKLYMAELKRRVDEFLTGGTGGHGAAGA